MNHATLAAQADFIEEMQVLQGLLDGDRGGEGALALLAELEAAASRCRRPPGDDAGHQERDGWRQQRDALLACCSIVEQVWQAAHRMPLGDRVAPAAVRGEATADVASCGAAWCPALCRRVGGLAMLGMRHGLAPQALTAVEPLWAGPGDREAWEVFLAFAASLSGCAEHARQLVQRREAEPGSLHLDVVLALSLHCAGVAGGERMVQRVLATSDDLVTRRFAQQVLGMAAACR